jgi:hypothetical protein
MMSPSGTSTSAMAYLLNTTLSPAFTDSFTSLPTARTCSPPSSSSSSGGGLVSSGASYIIDTGPSMVHAVGAGRRGRGVEHRQCVPWSQSGQGAPFPRRPSSSRV